MTSDIKNSGEAKVMEGIDKGPSPLELPSEYHRTHRDYQRFDKVVIETNERYKESYLSGDEWRFGASLKLYKNGYQVFGRSFMDVKTAAAFLE